MDGKWGMTEVEARMKLIQRNLKVQLQTVKVCFIAVGHPVLANRNKYSLPPQQWQQTFPKLFRAWSAPGTNITAAKITKEFRTAVLPPFIQWEVRLHPKAADSHYASPVYWKPRVQELLAVKRVQLPGMH